MRFEETINFLKNQGLITPESEAVICTDRPNSTAFLFGAIGASIAMANVAFYVLAVNENEIRIFDIDKYSGVYLNKYSVIEKSNIKKAAGLNSFGTRIVTVKTVDAGVIGFMIKPKYKGFKQKETAKKIVNIIKTSYSKTALAQK